ncbi:MAG TPA: hypothetical protein VF457_16255, partial [Burkholderiaceae bacterium]
MSLRLPIPVGPSVPRRPRRLLAAALPVLLAAGCGGGADPLSNPPSVQNPAGGGGDKLSFAYFQRCIQPIFLEQLPVLQGGGGTNTCAGSGCHASDTGTGGALRLIVSAQAVDLGDPANTPDVIRTTDMYKNFYSAQGVTIPGSPLQSRLFEKPLLLNVLHGGGQIFASQSDPHAQLINYWISHPAPSGQDEFSTATYNMFTPAYDPTSSDPTRNDLSKVACNT